jgi:cyclophilin family peptidyl-prolyl cis-trans isomerase
MVMFLVVVVVAVSAAQQAKPKPSAPVDPVLVLDTEKGTIEIRLFQAEAPKSVAHVVELTKRSFYRGQRFHRVTPSLAQIGDPLSRNMSRKDYWGTGNSGNPIGLFELSKKRSHIRGAVGLAHSGNPLGADSQFYIMKAASPGLDGKHAIIGQVVTGMTVVDKIKVPDMVKDTKLK